MIKSISYNQGEILKWITELYLDGKPFDLDPTYSKGMFYKKTGIQEPLIKSDIAPQVDDCLEIDVANMPWPDNSIESCIFDPPFMPWMPVKRPPGRMKSRFSYYTNLTELRAMYLLSIQEIYRILIPTGILVFKCQDLVDSGKQVWHHIEIYQDAMEAGFTAEDLFVLLASSRMNNWKRQLHARKYHCYFWVFRKLK